MPAASREKSKSGQYLKPVFLPCCGPQPSEFRKRNMERRGLVERIDGTGWLRLTAKTILARFCDCLAKTQTCTKAHAHKFRGVG